MLDYGLGMRPILVALIMALAAPAAAQDDIDDINPDSIVVDTSAKHAKLRKGRRLVSGDVTLAQPLVDGGRVVERVRVMQEWDCAAARYRTVRKTFRDNSGLFVHAEPRDGPWTSVTKDGPGWEMLKRVCPPQAGPAVSDAAPQRRGPQAVTMPSR